MAANMRLNPILTFLRPDRLRCGLSAALLALAVSPATAQVTNWIAYNDHRPGPLIPPHVSVQTNWGTALRVGTLDMGAPGDTTGNLINYLTGDPLAATVTFTRTGAPDDFGTVTRTGIPNPGSDAHRLFYGICDLSNDGIVGVDALDNDFVTISFANLNPAKRYSFRGTAARGGGYVPRWTICTINALSFIDAHLNGDGTGFGVITSNDFPANIQPGQAAFNSGHNKPGAVVGWDFVAPNPDGTFNIVLKQYVGPIPGGQMATDANYGYSFGAMILAEVEALAPTITTNPPAQLAVEQNRAFSLTVSANGAPLLYQWYKEGAGPVSGATFRTFTLQQAALGDSGNYYVVVYNPLGSVTSTSTHVTVNPDVTAPTIGAAIPFPTVTGLVASHNQIVIEFNELVQASSVSSTASYTVPGGGNPISVVVTNGRTVVLTLANPLAEDTQYTVSATGIKDLVGNTSGSISAQFRTWVTGPGNGLVFEIFDTSANPGQVEVSALLSDPNYPNNPSMSALLNVFDTRATYPDNSHGDYGGRIRGVFIPPVSGDYLFYLRTFDRGVVYLNPNGLDPAGAIEILRESTGNNPRNWDKFTSPILSLRAGQGYYMEAQYKVGTDAAGTAADVLKVSARLAGTGFPLPVDSPDTDVDANSISGAFVGYPLAPRDLGGTLTIAQGPANTTVEANHPASFTVRVNNPGNAAVFYQWYKNGSPILNANAATYTFTATGADSGATFSVRAAKIGSSATSGSATLTVVPDITPPHAVGASAPATNLNIVFVEFDETVSTADAEDEFNYALDDAGGPATAVLGSNGRTVTLTFADPLVLGSTHHVSIVNVADLIGLPISPSPTTLTFTVGASGQPSLEIDRLAGNAIVSWPASATGFVLEQTSQLQIPIGSTVWTPVGIAPTVVNGRNTVTVPITGNKTFRLRQ
jgi:hypothetical protein